MFGKLFHLKSRELGKRQTKCLVFSLKRVFSSSGEAGEDEKIEGSGQVSEELIARLKAAEEEARALKEQLNAQQASLVDSQPENQGGSRSGKRIDGGDLRRETLSFVETTPRNWLSESDVEFFTGGGPSEASGGSTGPLKSSEEEKSLVNRRIVVGLAGTVGLIAFALVPTEKLQPPPSKPLFFYLVPLLRTRDILDEIILVIPDGKYEKLRDLLDLVEGPPNNVQQNLKSAAASLESPALIEKADTIARDVYEYLKGIDYQTYYDSVATRGSRGGQELKEMFDFSSKSAAAAQSKLEEFLKLMPQEELAAAKSQAYFILKLFAQETYFK